MNYNVGNGQYYQYDCASSNNFSIPFVVTATNVCGSETVSDTVVSPSCDGYPARSGQNISISPNPVGGIASITLNNITLTDIMQILILDKGGNVVKRITPSFESQFNLDVSNYNSGIYNIVVNFKGQKPSISASFTVQH